MTEERPENILITTVAGILGATGLYALATDVFHLDTGGSVRLYILTLASLVLALIVRFVRLRRSRIEILVLHLPPAQEGDEILYLKWLLASSALAAYSSYQLATGSSGIFMIPVILSTVLMWVLAWGLLRRRA